MIPRYAIIVAGGSGTRMGSDIPKQFLELDGKSILRRSIERFTEALEGVHIITVLPKEHIDLWKERCLRDNFIVPQILVAGGITRFHSVKNALAKVPDEAIVGVHDGVRPFVSAGLLQRMYDQVSGGCPALIPVLPCTDTLKALQRVTGEDGVSRLETLPGIEPDRSILFGAQTPQVFRADVLKAAYSQPFSTAFTDDASVVSHNGEALSYIEGERLNLKITTPDDLVLARGILTI